MPQQSNQLPYRADIDGLRAIAVLGVMLYHAQIAWFDKVIFPGGFLGVDVFFVISGYLITALLVKEYKQTNTISIAQFYLRRARRIIPNMLAVIAIVFPFAVATMFPAQISGFAETVLPTIFFSSNFYWWSTLQAYGADDALLQPLLHFWSLAVEEQFYIFYPMLLIVGLRKGRLFVLALLWGLIILSFAGAIMTTKFAPSASFYLLPTRFWELAAGGVLAISAPKTKKIWHDAVANIGLIAIFVSFIVFSFGISHPGMLTLIPVVGSCCYIHFGASAKGLPNFLSTRLFVWIGVLSFSLYLWHYPIFAIGRIIETNPQPYDKTMWFLCTLFLSSISYRFIEKPFRFGRFGKANLLIPTLLISASVLGISSVGARIYFNLRIVDVNFEVEMNRRVDWNTLGYSVCNQITPEDCQEFRESHAPTILVVGDSMGPDAVRILAKNFPQYEYILSSAGWCLPYSGELRRDNNALLDCQKKNQSRFNPETLEGIDGVAIITIDYDANTFIGIDEAPSFDPYLEYLTNSGIKNIVIFGSYLRHSPRIFDLYSEFGGDVEKIESHVQIKNIDSDMQRRSSGHRFGAVFLSIRDNICVDDNCPIFIEDQPYSWDNHHWTTEFTDFLANIFSDELKIFEVNRLRTAPQ